MLFRLVRPVKRKGSRYRQFVRRIPADVKQRAVGVKLHIPVGEQTQVVVPTNRSRRRPSCTSPSLGGTTAETSRVPSWLVHREGHIATVP
jgi:hypothetical protein